MKEKKASDPRPSVEIECWAAHDWNENHWHVSFFKRYHVKCAATPLSLFSCNFIWIIFFTTLFSYFVSRLFYCQFAFDWSLFTQRPILMGWQPKSRIEFNRDTIIRIVHVFGSSSSRTIESLERKTEMSVSGYEMLVDLQWKNKRRDFERKNEQKGQTKAYGKECR